MIWLWKWLESPSNCIFSQCKDKYVYSICYFVSLIFFLTFQDYGRGGTASLASTDGTSLIIVIYKYIKKWLCLTQNSWKDGNKIKWNSNSTHRKYKVLCLMKILSETQLVTFTGKSMRTECVGLLLPTTSAPFQWVRQSANCKVCKPTLRAGSNRVAR